MMTMNSPNPGWREGLSDITGQGPGFSGSQVEAHGLRTRRAERFELSRSPYFGWQPVPVDRAKSKIAKILLGCFGQ